MKRKHFVLLKNFYLKCLNNRIFSAPRSSSVRKYRLFCIMILTIKFNLVFSVHLKPNRTVD